MCCNGSTELHHQLILANFETQFASAAERTKKMKFITGVTAAIYWYNPRIIAQAFSSLDVLYPGRIGLGIVTGEAMNEHLLDRIDHDRTEIYHTKYGLEEIEIKFNRSSNEKDFAPLGQQSAKSLECIRKSIKKNLYLMQESVRTEFGRYLILCNERIIPTLIDYYILHTGLSLHVLRTIATTGLLLSLLLINQR
ncbi:MAG: LLM class flavin-dependent oxidoreductase [Nitrososphaeraceae archaeon]